MPNVDLRSSIAALTGNRFQAFVSALLAAAQPGFQAIDGRRGDGGVDGITTSRRGIYQAYAPDTRQGEKTRRKIRESIEDAAVRRDAEYPDATVFVFVTPFDLEREELDLLDSAADARGFQGWSWGLSHLVMLLTQHREVAVAFPELHLVDVVAEVRAARGPAPEPDPWATIISAHDSDEGDMRHHLLLQRPDETGQLVYEQHRMWLRCFAPSRNLGSIEPDVEDALVAAVSAEFPTDRDAAITERDAHHAVAVHRSSGRGFHRAWAIFACGEIGQAFTIESVRTRGAFSITDLAVDVARACRLALLSDDADGPVLIRFTLDTGTLAPQIPSEDPRYRAHVAGVSDVRTSAPRRPFRISLRYELAEARGSAIGIAAHCLTMALRDLHGARVSRDAVAASMTKLLAEDVAAQLR